MQPEQDAVDPNDRVCCPDDLCTGILNESGTCGTCDRTYAQYARTPKTPATLAPTQADSVDGVADVGASVEQDAARAHKDPTALPPQALDHVEDGAGQASLLEDRVLCDDEMCVGIIGPDGTCGTCGEPRKSELTP
jgi:hypothetical protein